MKQQMKTLDRMVGLHHSLNIFSKLPSLFSWRNDVKDIWKIW